MILLAEAHGVVQGMQQVSCYMLASVIVHLQARHSVQLLHGASDGLAVVLSAARDARWIYASSLHLRPCAGVWLVLTPDARTCRYMH